MWWASAALVYTGSGTPILVGGTSLSSPVLYGVYLKGTCNTDSTTAEQICTTPAFHAPIAGFDGLYPETPGYNYDTGLGTFDTAAMVTAVKPFVPAVTKPGPGPGVPAPPPPGPGAPPAPRK